MRVRLKSGYPHGRRDSVRTPESDIGLNANSRSDRSHTLPSWNWAG